VGPRAGLDDLEKRKFLPPPRLELRSLGRPARSLSLYRLRSPGYYAYKYIHYSYLYSAIQNAHAVCLFHLSEVYERVVLQN
jgi:hypothetical protein